MQEKPYKTTRSEYQSDGATETGITPDCYRTGHPCREEKLSSCAGSRYHDWPHRLSPVATGIGCTGVSPM